MNEVTFQKHTVFRETDSVIFYDISVEGCNFQDLVIHSGAAISPPLDEDGFAQFYIHQHQTDNNRVLSGKRTFELVNLSWENPYHIVHLDRHSGALVIPPNTYHRSCSYGEGSILINQAIRDEFFDVNTEFIPVSESDNMELFATIRDNMPVIHNKEVIFGIPENKVAQ